MLCHPSYPVSLPCPNRQTRFHCLPTSCPYTGPSPLIDLSVQLWSVLSWTALTYLVWAQALMVTACNSLCVPPPDLHACLSSLHTHHPPFRPCFVTAFPTVLATKLETFSAVAIRKYLGVRCCLTLQWISTLYLECLSSLSPAPSPLFTYWAIHPSSSISSPVRLTILKLYFSVHYTHLHYSTYNAIAAFSFTSLNRDQNTYLMCGLRQVTFLPRTSVSTSVNGIVARTSKATFNWALFKVKFNLNNNKIK